MAKVQIVKDEGNGKFRTHKWTLGNVFADGREEFDTGAVSDGYHTFNELYKYRLLYNAALFNEWANRFDEANETRLYDVHKSWKHSNGEPCFGGGWFIVVAQLPTGQITNHYEAKDWDLFKIPARDVASEYDGHTPQQAAHRLGAFLRGELA